MRNSLCSFFLATLAAHLCQSCYADNAENITQQEKQQQSGLRDSFEEEYQELKSFYKDEFINAAFDTSQKDLKSFLPSTKQVGCPIGPPPKWEVAYLATIDDMSQGNWTKAKEDLAAARIAETRPQYVSSQTTNASLPDLLLLSAIANKALGQEKQTLGDLTELYELHRKAPNLWNGYENLFQRTNAAFKSHNMQSVDNK